MKIPAIAAFLLLSVVAAVAAELPEPRMLQLEEQWRIGGIDDEENLLGVVDRVLADDEGNVYLLDIQLVEVLVYDRDGEYVHSLGKRGDGPGEVRRAGGVMFLPDGTLGILQPFPGRIVKVHLDGTPAGEIRPGQDDPTSGGFFAVNSAACLGDRLVLGASRMTRDEDRFTAVNFLGDFDTDGKSGAVYLETSFTRERGRFEFVEKEFYFPHQAWALGPDGRVFVAPERNEYRIEVHGAGDGPERVITRDYESWERTADEMALAEQTAFPFRRGRNRGNMKTVMESTEPDIAAMRAAPDGSLWILPSRGLREQPEGIHSTWDVFDAEGTLTERVAVACEGEGGDDTLFFPGNGLAVLVKQHTEARLAFMGQGRDDEGDEDADLDASPLEIICYRLAP